MATITSRLPAGVGGAGASEAAFTVAGASGHVGVPCAGGVTDRAPRLCLLGRRGAARPLPRAGQLGVCVTHRRSGHACPGRAGLCGHSWWLLGHLVPCSVQWGGGVRAGQEPPVAWSTPVLGPQGHRQSASRVTVKSTEVVPVWLAAVPVDQLAGRLANVSSAPPCPDPGHSFLHRLIGRSLGLAFLSRVLALPFGHSAPTAQPCGC